MQICRSEWPVAVPKGHRAQRRQIGEVRRGRAQKGTRSNRCKGSPEQRSLPTRNGWKRQACAAGNWHQQPHTPTIASIYPRPESQGGGEREGGGGRRHPVSDTHRGCSMPETQWRELRVQSQQWSAKHYDYLSSHNHFLHYSRWQWIHVPADQILRKTCCMEWQRSFNQDMHHKNTTCSKLLWPIYKAKILHMKAQRNKLCIQ